MFVVFGHLVRVCDFQRHMGVHGSQRIRLCAPTDDDDELEDDGGSKPRSLGGLRRCYEGRSKGANAAWGYLVGYSTQIIR